MAKIPLSFGLSGGGSDEVTATKNQVLAGYTAITSDSNDEPIEGTIPSKSAATYNTSTNDQTIASNQYLNGKQTIKAVATENIDAENIKKGVIVKVGDANNASRIKNIEGTYTTPSSGQLPITLDKVLEGYSGFVNGGAEVKGNIPLKQAQTYNVSGSDQSITAGQYLNGAQTFRGVTTSNIDATNIKKGVVIKVGDAGNNGRIKNETGTYTTPSSGQNPVVAGAMLQGYSGFVNGGGEVKGNIPSKAATTYNVSGSDQTVAAGQYLSGAQTFKGVTTSNISAGNIRKGVNVKVGDTNNAGRIANVTGTWYGNKKCIGVSAYDSRSASDNNHEESFTMPASGMVYYGGCAGGWYYSDSDTNATCAIYKNGSVVDNANISSGNYTFRGGMFNKSFSANAGDVIKVVASCSRGSRGNFIMSAIQAVIVY